MANNNVFRGSDGSITLAVDSGPEGDAAKAVSEAYKLTTIGRATNVEVQVASDLKAFHELGQRYPTELRAGNAGTWKGSAASSCSRSTSEKNR